MFSKLIRSKSDTHTKDAPAPLRGMPALKHMRAMQREEKLSFRKSLEDEQSAVDEKPEKTGLGSSVVSNNDVSKINSSSDVVDVRRRRSNTTDKSMKSHQDGRRFSEITGVRNGKKTEENKIKDATKTTATNSSVKKKDEHRGRRLHSIKKRRKARRESISGSMQALTPRERESIIFLDDVIKQHDQSSLSGDWSDDDLFDLGEREDDGSDTDSSVGSVIDLVGNLSDCHVSPTSLHSSSPASHNIEQQNGSVANHDDVFRNEFLNRCNWQRSNQPRIYGEISTPQQKVKNQSSSNYDVYAEISDVLHSNKSLPSNTEEHPTPVNPEPVYSIVRKPKKSSQTQTALPKQTETTTDVHVQNNINSSGKTDRNIINGISSKQRMSPPVAPKTRSSRLTANQQTPSSNQTRQFYDSVASESLQTIDLNKNKLTNADRNGLVSSKSPTNRQRDLNSKDKPFMIVAAKKSDISWNRV